MIVGAADVADAAVDVAGAAADAAADWDDTADIVDVAAFQREVVAASDSAGP